MNFVSAPWRPDDLPSQFRRVRRLASGQASMFYADLKRKIAMATGTVKFFNSTKGFGFIEQDGGQPDVFVHISAVERAGMSTLAEGQKLSFEVVKDNRSGKSAAENLQAA
jgi:CspA family cold shock protein